jgi:hypothetical protein
VNVGAGELQGAAQALEKGSRGGGSRSVEVGVASVGFMVVVLFGGGGRVV